MYSDNWLELRYSHDEKTWLNSEMNVSYYIWKAECKPIGATINFEYAEDVHFEFI